MQQVNPDEVQSPRPESKTPNLHQSSDPSVNPCQRKQNEHDISAPGIFLRPTAAQPGSQATARRTIIEAICKRQSRLKIRLLGKQCKLNDSCMTANF